MKEALREGEPVDTWNPDSSRYADGVAVRQVWDLTFEIADAAGIHVITVTKEKLAKYVTAIKKHHDMLLEPSWALSIAAISREVDNFKKPSLNGEGKRTVVSIASWQNISEEGIKRTQSLSDDDDLRRINLWKEPLDL